MTFDPGRGGGGGVVTFDPGQGGREKVLSTPHPGVGQTCL